MNPSRLQILASPPLHLPDEPGPSSYTRLQAMPRTALSIYLFTKSGTMRPVKRRKCGSLDGLLDIYMVVCF